MVPSVRRRLQSGPARTRETGSTGSIRLFLGARKRLLGRIVDNDRELSKSQGVEEDACLDTLAGCLHYVS